MNDASWEHREHWQQQQHVKRRICWREKKVFQESRIWYHTKLRNFSMAYFVIFQAETTSWIHGTFLGPLKFWWKTNGSKYLCESMTLFVHSRANCVDEVVQYTIPWRENWCPTQFWCCGVKRYFKSYKINIEGKYDKREQVESIKNESLLLKSASVLWKHASHLYLHSPYIYPLKLIRFLNCWGL